MTERAALDACQSGLPASSQPARVSPVSVAAFHGRKKPGAGIR
ncbi:MAG: hypothetical protein M0030_14135 [Actinomycetota bacterium]|nr:hypothetical protein [Actinomycetota bacterium]